MPSPILLILTSLRPQYLLQAGVGIVKAKSNSTFSDLKTFTLNSLLHLLHNIFTLLLE